MNNKYKDELVENMRQALKGIGVRFVKYYHIHTIRIELPAEIDLENFREDFYVFLESLPEISHEREMVYFWLSQVGTANFFKILINPTQKAIKDWQMIGIGANTWVHVSEFNREKR